MSNPEFDADTDQHRGAVDPVVLEYAEEIHSENAVLRAPTSVALARFLDDLVRVPGTPIRLGADALLGFIPGIGDAVTTTMSGLILVDAARLRVPVPVLARMGLNSLADAALSQIPGLGDVADVAYKSNRRNVRLLDKSIREGRRSELSAVPYLASAAGIIALTLAVLVAATVWAIWLLGHLLGLW